MEPYWNKRRVLYACIADSLFMLLTVAIGVTEATAASGVLISEARGLRYLKY